MLKVGMCRDRSLSARVLASPISLKLDESRVKTITTVDGQTRASFFKKVSLIIYFRSKLRKKKTTFTLHID